MDIWGVVMAGGSVLCAAIAAMAKVLLDERKRLVQEKRDLIHLLSLREGSIESLEAEREEDRDRWNSASVVFMQIISNRSLSDEILGDIKALFEPESRNKT